MGKQTELNCLAEVTFVFWVFMPIITNNRKRLDVAESLSAGWAAGAYSAHQHVIFRARLGWCMCTRIPVCAKMCVIVLGPCI